MTDELSDKDVEEITGVRTLIVNSYDLPKFFFGFHNQIHNMGSSAHQMSKLGVLVWYGTIHTTTKKRKIMDIDLMVERWKKLMVGLCLAHDKDEADHIEASVEECLSPILTAPVKQLREFGPKLLAALKEDKQVPFLVWRPYEIWIAQMDKAPDQDIIELKTDLAKQIVNMVEADVMHQFPEAMISALQWRSPQKLEEIKTAIEKEKAAGRPAAKVKGRESCLFLEVEGKGTADEPEFCVQI